MMSACSSMFRQLAGKSSVGLVCPNGDPEFFCYREHGGDKVFVDEEARRLR